MNQQKKGKLFVISGPSGVGKGTLVNLLTEKHSDMDLSISVTTRLPRPGERNGIHYFFVDKQAFLDRIDNDSFLEWTQFAGNYYGTDKNIVESSIQEGKNLILEIDVKGALQVKQKKPEAVLLFIEPPSLEELKSRLFKRKTESEEEIKTRLSIVKSEIDQKSSFDYCIQNGELNKAFSDLENILIKESDRAKSC